MAIIFDDSKSIDAYLRKPDAHPESFLSLCRRLSSGLQLVSDDIEQDRKEQEELEKLREKSFERKCKLLYDNLELIMRHREEIVATPRYANIDAHYAIKGGGCYVGPISTSRRYDFAGSSIIINLSLGSLLELWNTEQFRVECGCGGSAVIRSFSGSPLSGVSVASAYCPQCKKAIRGIRNRSFGGYMGLLRTKLDQIAENALNSGLRSDGQACNLETMINELKLKEFAEV